MARFPRLAAALLVAAGLVVAWSVHAQPPGALPAPGPGVPGGAPESPGKVPGIPPFSLLGAEPVQSELKLTDEQKQRVRDLIAEFDKQARADMTAMQQTAPELQQAKMGQLQQAAAKRVQTLRAQLEAALLPQQLAQLQQIALQMTVVVHPQVLEQMGMTEQQRKSLDQIRNQAQAKMWETQREMAKKTFSLLTPEQLKRFQELVVQSPGGP